MCAAALMLLAAGGGRAGPGGGPGELGGLGGVHAMRIHRPWNLRHWCEVIEQPHWPFAYSKVPGQATENKGRTASNYQHMGHECAMRGAKSKCHICEDIACTTTANVNFCHYQIQGVDWDELPKNIPTISNTPWAVGPNTRHRNDFGRANRICVMLSGEECIVDKATQNLDHCAVRCWASDYGDDLPLHLKPTPDYYTSVGTLKPGGSVGWVVDRTLVGFPGKPQGYVQTWAGQEFQVGGYRDGLATSARFNNPTGLVVDRDRNVYVADTSNHLIRKISISRVVTTIAGRVPVVAGGFQDGPALAGARFSSPTGISLYYKSGDTQPTLVVADTDNHRIRLIYNGIVSTLAGDQRGLADGSGLLARFDTPFGLAAANDGTVFVADTLNFLIRKIDTAGNVVTIAGNTTASPNENAGCPPPCLDGISGYRDGPLRYAQFYWPYDVAISPNGTVVVADGDRIRRITADFTGTHNVQEIYSRDRVVTVAGELHDGKLDGIGPESTFDKPRGVVVASDDRIYVADSVSCRIRRITRSRHVARHVGCKTRIVDVIRPEGCDMYDPAVDNIDNKASQVSNNIHYNYQQVYLEANGDATHLRGKLVHDCVGVPEPDLGIESNDVTDGARGGTLSRILDIKEDTGDETTLRFECPAGCQTEAVDAFLNGGTSESGVWGTGNYSDISKICASAIHAGVIDDTGGLISVQLRRGIGEYVSGHGNDHFGKGGLNGSVSNFITSQDDPWHWRVFNVQPYLEEVVEVQTIAGHPNAPLDDPCGYVDTQPPQYAKFHRPSAVAVYTGAHLTANEYLYVADAGNNVIRAITAVCSKVCENGGECVTDEVCKCADGWKGDDCTIPICDFGCYAPPGTTNRICTAPNRCTCKPGYSGPRCNVALCVQTCENGATCVAPDTCDCKPGWFDPNCTTPVCDQTCGNGGNCTLPNTCTCPDNWEGADCRTPICNQVCGPHGHCIAPDTCECHVGWSGHDCSKPVCTQGYFRRDPVVRAFGDHKEDPAWSPSPWREPSWKMYTPCNITAWCEATGTFDCSQLERIFTPLVVPPERDNTGWRNSPEECHIMELAVSLGNDATGKLKWTPFRYEQSTPFFTAYSNLTEQYTFYARETPETPYDWGPLRSSLQRDPLPPGAWPWSSPGPAPLDRQIALVSWQDVAQGVYICANGGNCTAPDTCVCADGWVGYDCRIPVCNQGYFEPHRPDARYPGQGTYECSYRSFTLWEQRLSPTGKFQGYMHEHPNYFSRYMNDTKGWLTSYHKTAPLNDDTVEGWRRDGWWELINDNMNFTKGYCLPLYNRTCPVKPLKNQDLRNHEYVVQVDDTQLAFEERVVYSIWTAIHEGRWDERGGECTDEVLHGCYNNGTCVAPDTCLCAPGWEGEDCSIPICEQSVVDIVDAWGINATAVPTKGGKDIHYRECKNNGNCTRPNECTCEKGWEGYDCSIPICAQECMNGGVCVAPDTCDCDQYWNTFRDGRDGGGRPLFQQDNGDPQFSGWTGFDCNTPICVQAERWVPNDVRGSVVLEKTVNDGTSFQAGCPTPSEFISPNRTRISDQLCRVREWYQGHYQLSWANALGESFDSKGRLVKINHVTNFKLDPILDVWTRGADIAGEGLYACYNTGSCIAPDTCACSDGWHGFDCNTPLCRHVNFNGKTVSCLNNGICADRDNCTCIQSPSILHFVHPDEPEGITGFTGTDCSIAICVQGFYDPLCINVPPFDTGVASGGEGCYRCANGGNCTSPDLCTCTDEWTGHDCKTPVCTATADAETVFHLNTVDAAKVQAFELDPCGMNLLQLYNGAMVGQGNCSAPNTCTCLCRVRTWLNEDNELVELPWADPLNRELPPGFAFGDSDCLDGYQGTLNPDGSFRTCHLEIYVPSTLERYSLTFIILGTFFGVGLMIFYYFLRRKLRERYMLAKAERRRSRRSSEEQNKHKPSAFGHT